MQRTIVGFHRDEEDQWVAELDCYHGQHMRHTPPFYERFWVLTEEGRATRLGRQVECLKCDQFEWPEKLLEFKRTPEFTEETVPAGLLRDHRTKGGVWAKIIVIEGTILYSPEAGEPIHLTPSRFGIIVPEMKHSVQLLTPVRFYVEFYHLPAMLEE
ncbi:MAG: DUF3565 domain-containing protein [Candidatus Kapaibacterium sp.]